MENLGPFDQLPFLRSYTQMLLCFPLKPTAAPSTVVPVLEAASQAIMRDFPFLAGQIKHEKDQTGEPYTSGKFHIIPYHHPNDSVLRIKYLTDDFPSYTEISEAKAPASMLDGRMLAPMKGLPDHYDDDSETTPVLIIQANFVQGGLLLCFAGMHNAVDGNGLGQIIRLFAIACRGESFSIADIQAAHLDRTRYIPPLDTDQTPLEHLDLRKYPNEASIEQPGNPPPTLWTYFRFSATKLAKLKANAFEDLSANPSIPWVSTNDALTALIWKALSKARSAHLNLSDDTVLLRAMNGRGRLCPPVPDCFLGNTVICTAITLPLRTLLQPPSLPATTTLIRTATSHIDDFYIRSLAHLIRSTPDKRTISFEVNHPERDFCISSWADLPIYKGNFGPLLGMPDFVRRPVLTPCEGLAFMMPKDMDGNLDAAVGVREDDLERLMGDEEWMGYAEFVG